jgi:hypothetical protein
MRLYQVRVDYREVYSDRYVVATLSPESAMKFVQDAIADDKLSSGGQVTIENEADGSIPGVKFIFTEQGG